MPKLLPRQYAKMLYELTHDADKKDIPAIVDTFFAYLKREHVTSRVEHIISEFEVYTAEQEGTLPLTITTARKMSSKEINNIAKQFASDDVVVTIDEDIQGGMIVQKGNTIFDASIRTQINRLKQELM